MKASGRVSFNISVLVSCSHFQMHWFQILWCGDAGKAMLQRLQGSWHRFCGSKRHDCSNTIICYHERWTVICSNLKLAKIQKTTSSFSCSRIYPNPEVFNPDNFSAENKAKRPSYAYYGFGQGPRNCIAMRFAVMQVKIALIKLLYSFKLVKGPKTPDQLLIDPRSLQGMPKGGPWLKVEERWCKW